MMGAFAYTGCADDSGNSAPEQQTPEETINLTVNPNTLTLVKGADGSFEVEYKANAEVSINTSDNNCVSVKDAKIVLGDNKKGTVSVTAVGEGCNANITVASDGQSKSVAVSVVGADALFLQLDKTNIALSAPGGDSDSAVVNVTYSKGANGVKHGALTITNNDSTCVGVPPSKETDDAGKASIDVKALKADCSAEVTVSADGNNGKIDKKFTVTVAKDGSGPEPSIEIKGDPTLTFDPESDTVAYEKDAEHNFTVLYVDGDKKAIAGAKITLESTNSSCIDITGKTSPLTGDDGKVSGTYQIKADNCTATVKATTPKTSAEMTVVVGEITEYDAKIALSLNSSRYDAVGYAGYQLMDASCADIGDLSALADLGKSYEDATEDITTSNKPILATFDAKKVDVIKKSVIGFAKNSSSNSQVLAYGCKDISVADAGQTITVDLLAVPTNIIGKYDLVSNFDLTSGFEKTECNKADSYKNLGICVPAVENMKPGDWVKFVTDFCSEPLITLLEFVWSNTLDRLINMKDDEGNSKLPEWAKSLLGTGTKAMALSALESYLDKLLGSTGDWYKILKEVAPDITDLTTNMQLVGTLDVIEANGTDVTKATEDYKELQYQWSYKANEAKNCIANAYGNSKCRKSVALSTKNGLNMSGEWNGKITLSEDAEDMLEINSHALNFKWASMLFVGVFGSILPEALGYTVKEGAYIKGFLSKILFEPIVNAYNADEDHKDTQVNMKAGKECEAFVEAIVRLIVNLGDTTTGMVQTLAGMACSDNVIGKLDTLLIGDKNCDKKCADITDSKVKEACEACEAKTGEEKVACQADYRKSHCGVLDTFQASTANGLNFSSKECRLYDEGTINYTMIGKADEPAKSANAIFLPNSKEETDRCTWDVDFKISDKPVNLKGLFHATRQK